MSKHPTRAMTESLLDRMINQVMAAPLKAYRAAKRGGNPDEIAEARKDIYDIVPNREMMRSKGFNLSQRPIPIARLRRPRRTPSSLETLISIPLNRSDGSQGRIVVPRSRVTGTTDVQLTARSGKGKNRNKLKGKKQDVVQP